VTALAETRAAGAPTRKKRATVDPIVRFMSKVDRNAAGGCWIWIACRGSGGYGRFGHGRSDWAHRVSWELHRGPIPEGMFVCHSCDVRACVNPDHLWLGTNADNLADMRAKGRAATGDRHGSQTKPESRPRGERHGSARLTEEDVREIRRRRSAGEPQQRVANHFGISQGRVSEISRGLAWRHVT
jgi:hypothetical protein